MNTQYPVRIVDLAAIRNNVRLLRQDLPENALLLAVVKADAYGHGIVQVARNALHAGASWLAVARTAEGAVLRNAGIDAPVLVLGSPSDAEIEEGVRCGLTLAVPDPSAVLAVQRAAEEAKTTGFVHVKLDTGMGRIGARTEEEVSAVLDAVSQSSRVRLTGVFTHFADADGEDEAYTRMQLDRFISLSRMMPTGIIRHCANSAAIHRYPDAAFDMVRAGISMYGYPPVKTDMHLEPALSWQTAVTFVKEISPGDKISYGCTFTADNAIRVATIACGYGDGYHRCASGKAYVIIRGKRCPVIGRICMDQMMADVTDVPEAVAGDVATLIGRDGEACITAEELAQWCGTISYEVLLSATERVHCKWINECDE